MASPVAISARPVFPSPARDGTGDVAAPTDIEKMRKAFQELEGFLLSQLLSPMFSEVEPAQPFGGGFGESMWKSLQVEQYGQALAKSGGIGLADAMVRSMLQAREAEAEAKP